MSELRQRLIDSATGSPSRGAAPAVVRRHSRTHVHVRRLGVLPSISDFYFYLLALRWYYLIPVLLCMYMVTALFYAGLHMVVPGQLLRDGVPTDGFWDTLYVSLAIMADTDTGVTLQGVGKQILVLAEGLTQLVELAIMVGVVVDRLTRPRARVRFAKQFLISVFNGQPVLTFRLAWERSSRVLDASIHVFMYQRYRTPEGITGMRLVEIPLALHEMPIFQLSWNIRHVIDEASPLADYARQLGIVPVPAAADAETADSTPVTRRATPHAGSRGTDDICARIEELELFCVFRGEDETHRETIRAFHTYYFTDLQLNARYADVIEYRKDGDVYLNMRAFDTLLPMAQQHWIGGYSTASTGTVADSSAAPHTPVQAEMGSARTAPKPASSTSKLGALGIASPATALHGLMFSLSPFANAPNTESSVNQV